MLSMTRNLTAAAIGRHATIALVLVLACGIVLPGTAASQTSDEALRRLTKAFATSDADALIEMATTRVDIALLGSSREFSRSQATLLMRSFFRENRAESFHVDDFTKTGRGWFIEASYATRNRLRPFRVYVRLRLGETGWLVREIMIEEARE
jgi:hypothetical protein